MTLLPAPALPIGQPLLAGPGQPWWPHRALLPCPKDVLRVEIWGVTAIWSVYNILKMEPVQISMLKYVTHTYLRL